MNAIKTNTVWVVVANSNRARIFSSKALRSQLKEHEVLVHPQARLMQQDLVSGAPGRAFDSFGKGRHSMGQQIDAKKQQRIIFAEQIADLLEKSRIQNKFERLIIIAAPEFLGDLRNKLSPQTAGCIELSTAKDLTAKDIIEIQQHISNI